MTMQDTTMYPETVYVPTKGNGLAVAGMVLGIIGVLFGLIPLTFFFAWILGVLAVVFGAIGRGRAKREPMRGGKGMATSGLVLGIVALLLGVLGVVIIGKAANDISDEFDKIDARANDPAFQNCLAELNTTYEDCVARFG